MKLDRRVYRTRDGRLVWQGDPDAAFLAYPVGRDVAESIVARIGGKQAAKPQDKQAAKPADKSGLPVTKRPPASGPGSGVEAWREYVAAATGQSPAELAELSRDDLIALVE